MTVGEALGYVDRFRTHTLGKNDIIKVLSDLEGHVYCDVLSEYESDLPPFTPFDENVSPQYELYIKPPHDMVYVMYLVAYVDFVHGEYARYNNGMLLFNSAWDDWEKYYLKGRKPKIRRRIKNY